MHCTLLVADLLPPAPDLPPPRAPALATLLARADAAAAGTGHEAWLCEACGVARERDWPVAPLTLAADGGDPAGGWWLRCDPVHLVLRHNGLHASDIAVATDDEARAIACALDTHFTANGLAFRAGVDGRCYVRDDAHSDVATVPLAAALGRDVDGCLPMGAHAAHWRRVLNEIQMLLHGHPVNAAREARGLPPLNSVWLWGGGRLPRAATAPWQRLWADDPLARGLGQFAGIGAAPLPASADAVFDAGEDALVALAAASADAAGWTQSIEQLERAWFAPALAALRGRRLARLSIVATGARNLRFDLAPRALWRWWRRPRPLDSHG